MKYTKPQITNTESASFAIMQIGKQSPVHDAGLQTSNPAYEADE